MCGKMEPGGAGGLVEDVELSFWKSGGSGGATSLAAAEARELWSKLPPAWRAANCCSRTASPLDTSTRPPHSHPTSHPPAFHHGFARP